MVKFEVITSVADVLDGKVDYQWIWDASDRRGSTELRVRTPEGLRLVRIEDFHLTHELHPDDDVFHFAGRVGTFGAQGFFDVLAEHGEVEVDSGDADIRTLLQANNAMTALEFWLGFEADR